MKAAAKADISQSLDSSDWLLPTILRKSDVAFVAALAKSSTAAALAENVPPPSPVASGVFLLEPVARGATMCEVPKEAQLAASRAKITDDCRRASRKTSILFLFLFLFLGTRKVVTTGQQDRREHCIRPIIHRPQDCAHFLALLLRLISHCILRLILRPLLCLHTTASFSSPGPATDDDQQSNRPTFFHSIICVHCTEACTSSLLDRLTSEALYTSGLIRWPSETTSDCFVHGFES